MRIASLRFSSSVAVASLIVGQLLLGTVQSFAHEGHDHETEPPRLVEDREIFQATPLPDRIVLTWSGDPTQTQSVTWRTDPSVRQGFAEIAVSEPGPHFAPKAQSFLATTELLVSDAGAAHYHSVKFTGLKPATKYAYRVGDKVNWSEWFHFTTASDRPEPFSFIYFGDAQNMLRMHWSRVIREAYSDAPKARFMIHAGDLVNHGSADSEWGEWFYAGGWLNAMIPSICTPGNHEYKDDDESTYHVTRHWRPQFTLPTCGPEGLEETVYSIDYQGVRIISLNSNEKQEEQIAWLDRRLAENPNRWTVVTFHHPIYSAKAERDNPEIRAWWKPLFDKYRVDLVLQGHDHSYARTGLNVPQNPRVGTENAPTGATAQSPEGGTVYVVSVSGPKLYDVDRQDFMKRVGEGIQLYQIIHVDGDRMRYEARTAVGDLYDAFTLVKRPNEKNELIDQIPDTPESLPSQTGVAK